MTEPAARIVLFSTATSMEASVPVIQVATISGVLLSSHRDRIAGSFL
nr:hypothetical protein [uncultured Rhodopila sp.]